MMILDEFKNLLNSVFLVLNGNVLEGSLELLRF